MGNHSVRTSGEIDVVLGDIIGAREEIRQNVQRIAMVSSKHGAYRIVIL